MLPVLISLIYKFIIYIDNVNLNFAGTSPPCTCPTTTSITGTVAGSFGGLTIGVILGIFISVFIFVCHHRHLCGAKRELYIVHVFNSETCLYVKYKF